MVQIFSSFLRWYVKWNHFRITLEAQNIYKIAVSVASGFILYLSKGGENIDS